MSYPLLGRHSPRIKSWARLHKGSERRAQGLVPIEGVRVLEEARGAGWRLENLLFREDVLDDARGRALVEWAGERALQAAPETLERLCETEQNQGLLGIFHLPAAPPSGWRSLTSLLVLDHISDPGNLGTLLRAAAGAGVGGALLRGGCDPFSGKVIRASAGAIFRLPMWHDVELAALGAEGWTLLAAVVDGGQDYFTVKTPAKVAWVLGGEANGLTAPSLQQCHGRVTLPMADRCESLNVAMAGTILMWEWRRRQLQT